MGKTVLIVLFFAFLGLTLGIVCPDARYRCPNTSTCCKTSQGYGCCPYVDANCCSDELHCCPSHLTCDVAESRCVAQNGVPFPFSSPMSSWSEVGQTTLVRVESDLKKQTCPDGKQKCPEKYTCCPMQGGGYGCCPENGGVCCSDGVHCCPHGKVCNLESGSCDAQ